MTIIDTIWFLWKSWGNSFVLIACDHCFVFIVLLRFIHKCQNIFSPSFNLIWRSISYNFPEIQHHGSKAAIEFGEILLSHWSVGVHKLAIKLLSKWSVPFTFQCPYAVVLNISLLLSHLPFWSSIMGPSLGYNGQGVQGFKDSRIQGFKDHECILSYSVWDGLTISKIRFENR